MVGRPSGGRLPDHDTIIYTPSTQPCQAIAPSDRGLRSDADHRPAIRAVAAAMSHRAPLGAMRRRTLQRARTMMRCGPSVEFDGAC